MKDSSGNIIYIGKAKNLRKRVGSYFSPHTGVSNAGWLWKTSKLVSKIADIDFIVTDNEIEAFLLESNLIKRYRPIFNIELKDQQRYTYLKVTDEMFPRLLVARRNRNGKFSGPSGKIYGPFVRGSSKFLTVGLLRKLFKIRTCTTLPKSPCLQYFIKNCDAPCINKVTREKYMENVSVLRDILEGKSSIDRFASEMESEMKSASMLQQYERAKEIRDTLQRLNGLMVRQKMEKASSKNPDEEYVGIAYDWQKGVAHVMALRRTHGVISDRKKFEFELVGDNSFATFLLQYYSSSPVIPRFVYVNQEPESRDVLEMSLEKLAGHKVSIVAVSKEFSWGEKRGLVDLVTRNLELYIEKGHEPALAELKDILGLSTVPLSIDCFDISNLGTSFSVGACVRFVNGRPDKSSYRKFRINSVRGQDDFAMINEVVRRRYSQSSQKGRQDSMPDLVVIDGGKGQLSAALSAMLEVGLDKTPCIALAKENEEIYLPHSSAPLQVAKSSPALKILQNLRDEAHRFGLAYNVSLRKLARGKLNMVKLRE